jgi:hypothetical protein
MTHRFGVLRRFRFNFPQRIAAAFLALLLVQGLGVILRRPLTTGELTYARCGHALWTGAETSACHTLGDGLLDERLAALSFEHDSPLARLLLRLPFLAASLLLGGCLWWVSRRLYGNRGGYTAIALYCASPAILAISTTPNPEILAALGLYSGVYTAIGVAHAMQGPRRKWRPRIVLLTLTFAAAATAHLAALALTLALGLGFMLWVGEGRRKPIFPVLAAAALGSLLLHWICAGFCRSCFQFAPTSFQFSLAPARQFFLSTGEIGITLATGIALLLYAATRRSRYFGNTTPLLCAMVFFFLAFGASAGAPWLWAIPFLLTFVAGVFADAYEGAHPQAAFALGATLVAAQLLVGLWHAIFSMSR